MVRSSGLSNRRPFKLCVVTTLLGVNRFILGLMTLTSDESGA